MSIPVVNGHWCLILSWTCECVLVNDKQRSKKTKDERTKERRTMQCVRVCVMKSVCGWLTVGLRRVKDTRKRQSTDTQLPFCPIHAEKLMQNKVLLLTPCTIPTQPPFSRSSRNTSYCNSDAWSKGLKCVY